ncbi:MAG: phosphoglucosamine mutase [Oscillospiraceae bacterium]|nr:phosphoglucosamine mutase [Oscillospiraceae bacterium]
MGKLFGTDGIRGVANRDLTAQMAFSVGVAAASVLTRNSGGRPVITIGKDTRLSGDMLESALAAGLCAGGADAYMLGVAPTPAVAYITTSIGADAGVVISASHNPFGDNGIKIFNSQGFKLSDELEDEIELIVLSGELPLAEPSELGRVTRIPFKLRDTYIEHLHSCVSVTKKLKIAVDCSNGAAAVTAERVFAPYASELHIIHNDPDGKNINAGCGSTAPASLCAEVVRLGCDIGFALDGDADRCIASDERGNIVDGDKIMAIVGSRMIETGTLKGGAIVATVYSNLGFGEFARERGITLKAAQTGDRNVLELMQKENHNLGGEQSGHIIFLDDATTGDGQLAAIKMLEAVTAFDKPTSELAAAFKTYPQELVNVALPREADKDAIMGGERLQAAIAIAERELGDRGRVLVRPSGTEPKLRVMVEAPTSEQALRLANAIADCVPSDG